MTAPLLSVGDATVWPSIWGGHLVDNGSAFPQHFADRRTAYAEAAARSVSSPPPGPPASRFDADGRVVGVAGLPDGQPSRGAVGRASGPSVASPGSAGPDAPSSSSQPHGAAGVEGSAGVATCEAVATPAGEVPA